MYEDDDLRIDEFLTQLTSEEYKSVESSKDIDSNFSALDEVLISINAIKLTFANPELKIDKKIRNKVLVVIPNKAKYSEDDKIISDIKAYKNMYELDIQKTNELIDGIKNNFIIFSDSVNALIELGKKYIASGSSDAIIIIWELTDDYDKYILKQKIIGHEFSVIGLAYLDNDRLISASIDDTIKIWQRNQSDKNNNEINKSDKNTENEKTNSILNNSDGYHSSTEKPKIKKNILF